ncbi:MAG TPA: glutathione S-transferase C-terminal domain-containing protein [Chthoniobacterales bacterium]|nr:glutathione S-transferase C-terminal domain-containing protein [Chthoniobacterales bacterium]
METKAQFAHEQSILGEFQRQEDAFRDWVSADGSTAYPAVADRYHLYVSLACPWASRTVIVRHLQGLENVVGLTVVDPVRGERGWAFRDGPGFSRDSVNGFEFLAQAYHATDPEFDGRVTVPVLWDKATGRIVNNSEDDICRMFDGAFRGLATRDAQLFPPDLAKEQAELSEFIYQSVNNGVYRAGFATRQTAYERAARKLFAALDELETRLTKSRYLFGHRIVESDWRLFCTLIRFDVVYYIHFKCSLRGFSIIRICRAT